MERGLGGEGLKQVPSVSRLVQPHLREFEPYVGVDPSEVLAQKAGVPAERVIKLDGNENPYGPSPRVLEALAGGKSYHLYPDPLQRQVRGALAAYAGTEPERVVAGSGCDELLDLVARLFLGPGEAAVDLPPTFGMYPFCVRLQGARVLAVSRGPQFEVDVAAVKRACGAGAKVVFLSNPNPPTGALTPEAEARELLSTGAVVVVDETYHEFSGFTVAPLVPEYENLVVLRSFSKWAGLAGLRLGYGVMSPEVARYLMSIKPPYNVSQAATVALTATLEDLDALLHRVRAIVEERERMAALLGRLPGVSVYPSKANFLLCRFPSGRAGAVHQGLMAGGIFVRALGGPRLGDCLRISVGRPEHTDALVAALRQLLARTP
jgi:histidinol-phosphate aminotransferase